MPRLFSWYLIFYSASGSFAHIGLLKNFVKIPANAPRLRIFTCIIQVKMFACNGILRSISIDNDEFLTTLKKSVVYVYISNAAQGENYANFTCRGRKSAV